MNELPEDEITTASLEEVEFHEAEYQTTRFDEPDPNDDSEEPIEWGNCQQCGAMLEEDAQPYSIDVVRRPYVTASGDVYCDVCGSEMDQADEEAMDEDFFDDWYPGEYDMLDDDQQEWTYIGDDE